MSINDGGPVMIAALAKPKGYWRCVGKSRPLTVTVEDVAEYSRPGKDGGT